MPIDSATRSILGVDADLIGVFATSITALIVVIGGVLLYRYRLEVQSSSERFLTQGIQSLYSSLSILLSIHLQNFQIGTYIIRAVRTYELDHPLAPQPSELPEFVGLRLESLPIDSLLLVQELIGDQIILRWMMQAISDITLEAKELEFQIRQPTAALFRSTEKLSVQKEKLISGLTFVLEAWNTRCATHFALRDRLHDLDNHVSRKRPWTIRGYYGIRNRNEVKSIVKAMNEGWCKVMVAHNQTAEVLRTGGYTSS